MIYAGVQNYNLAYSLTTFFSPKNTHIWDFGWEIKNLPYDVKVYTI
jgi:hypothetical protein